MDAAEVKKKVDRLAELDRQMVAVKGEDVYKRQM